MGEGHFFGVRGLDWARRLPSINVNPEGCSVLAQGRYRKWLIAVHASEPLPADPVGEVARFPLNHEKGLTRCVDNPALPLDNNGGEWEFRRHAKLRHASFVAGCVSGAARWAKRLRLVQTAQKCGIDVQRYVAGMFDTVGTHRARFGRTPAELTLMAYRYRRTAIDM